MAIIKDKDTNLTIADPDQIIFPGQLPHFKDVKKALDPMILSASGWRKIFTSNGDEESQDPSIGSVNKILIAAMAFVFSQFLQEKSGKKHPTITLALDSRPTGPEISDIITRVFNSLNINVQYMFICAAPEVMAWAGNENGTDGFVYISASHNPIGHNGAKFGLTSGGVVDGKDANTLINAYRALLSNDSNITILVDLINSSDRNELETIYNNSHMWKKKAFKNYISFTKRVISGTSNETNQNQVFNIIKNTFHEESIGVIAELNGSARTLTIDKVFLEELHVKVKIVNGNPREITHRIIPEGVSLDLCRRELEKAHRIDKSFQLGYVPDCDGDRGNLVYIDEGKAKRLEAQEVFALSVLAELSYLKWINPKSENLAVVVNGPTSMRIEEIAHSYNASVFRAEVGEANVVNLANDIRSKAYEVPILGEGSNGGNITYPAAVRDPLNTIGALLKLLSIKSVDKKMGLFELWCQASDQMDQYKSRFTISDIVASLPHYTTTSAFEENAIMKIKSHSHIKLKKKYESKFEDQWQANKKKLNELLNICSWREVNYESTKAKEGIGSAYRSGDEKGGLKIIFEDKNKKDMAYIWMRGSGTEPVFRVLADVKGKDRKTEQFLLNWQREMIESADQ